MCLLLSRGLASNSTTSRHLLCVPSRPSTSSISASKSLIDTQQSFRLFSGNSVLFKLSFPCISILHLPDWLQHAMARHLDPKLHRIIEDASRNMQSSDVSHPSVVSNDFAHALLNHHPGRRQVTGEPGFTTAAFQLAHSGLDDFGTYCPSPVGCHLADGSDLA